jgi:hypothetical protein
VQANAKAEIARIVARIPHAFAAGDFVQVREYDGQQRWRDAVLMKLEPYRGRPGYRFCWDPLPRTDPATGISPSVGGWTQESMVRPRPADEVSR